MLLASFLLTIKLHAQVQNPVPAPTGNQAPAAHATTPVKKSNSSHRQGDSVTLYGLHQEKHGNLYSLRGDAEVDFRTYVLKADEITYNDETAEAKGRGHASLVGGPYDLHMTGSHFTYNLDTENGRFWDASGTTGWKAKGATILLTSSIPFSFQGEVIDKVGPDKIIVNHGWVTSCSLPKPKWLFQGQVITVIPGDDAKIRNGVFWLWHMPLLYSPYFDQPVERDRKSGFLMPFVGDSNTKGIILGDGFFWAINRSMDALVGAEYLSKRGGLQRTTFHGIFNDTSYLNASYFSVYDRGLGTQIFTGGPGGVSIPITPPNGAEGGQEITATGETRLFQNVRAVGSLDYLSSFLFRAVFAPPYTAGVSTETRSTAFLTDDPNGYSLNAMVARYQDFQNTIPDDVVAISHAPTFQASGVDRPLLNLPVYWGFDASASSLYRSTPTQLGAAPYVAITKASAGRFDVAPDLSLPVFWRGWTLRPEVTLRDTYYTDSINRPTDEASITNPINRHALDSEVELMPPALSRVFDRPVFGRKLKHAIESDITYRNVTGVANFSSIPRFDEVDILNDTSEATVGVTQRLYAKPVTGKCLPKQPAVSNVRSPEKQTEAAQPQPPVPAALPGQPPNQGQIAASLVATAPAAQERQETPPGCEAREIVSWEVAEKYFFDPKFGGALQSGELNVLESTVQLTGLAFLTQPRNWSPVISRLRVRLPKVDGDWQLDYDPVADHINSSYVSLNYRINDNYVFGGGDAVLLVPPSAGVSETAPTEPVAEKFNQFRLQGTYGHVNKLGLTASAIVGFDSVQDYLQYVLTEATYNWDCCGMTVEYRRFALGTIRTENEYRFTLSLSNIGTFGDLRKNERLY
ncbi:MAG: LPS assembly protein LptD [Terriglobales bacterium]